MKDNAILVGTSLLSILLLTLHITDDIVRGISKAESSNTARLFMMRAKSSSPKRGRASIRVRRKLAHGIRMKGESGGVVVAHRLDVLPHDLYHLFAHKHPPSAAAAESASSQTIEMGVTVEVEVDEVLDRFGRTIR